VRSARRSAQGHAATALPRRSADDEPLVLSVADFASLAHAPKGSEAGDATLQSFRMCTQKGELTHVVSPARIFPSPGRGVVSRNSLT
jgi:hypothetical protein